MKANIEQTQMPLEDARLPYSRPDLIDVGTIADVTRSNGNGGGGDGGYS